MPCVHQLRQRIPRKFEPQIPTQRLGDREPHAEWGTATLARLNCRETCPTNSHRICQRLLCSMPALASLADFISSLSDGFGGDACAAYLRLRAFHAWHVSHTDERGLPEA